MGFRSPQSPLLTDLFLASSEGCFGHSAPCHARHHQFSAGDSVQNIFLVSSWFLGLRDHK